MKNKYFVILILVIIIVLSGAIFFNKQKAESPTSDVRNQLIQDELTRPEITINTKYQFKEGKHIFVGNLELPTPCHSYEYEIKRNPELIEIAFKILNPEQDLVCEQVITERPFKVVFEGQGQDEIIATLDGNAVNLNVFEVGPDEDIEDIDIFIKG